jgi:hypothetical protein
VVSEYHITAEEYKEVGTLDMENVAAQKPRSGYGRLRNRHRELIALYERLESDHAKLQRHHEALKVGHEELQAAFDELLGIHNGLLADLKQSHQVRTTAQSFPLMGGHRG